MTQSQRAAAPLWLVLTALGIVYVVWGSTYLAIRYVVETMPPFLAAGTRFLCAGGILFAFMQWRSPQRLTLEQWRSAALIGALLLLGGNGLVCWAEQSIPSGVAALIVATVPLWFALLDWLVLGGPRPTFMTATGLVIGLAGVWMLVRPAPGAAKNVNVLGVAALIAACIAWSFGSLLTKRVRLPANTFVSTAMQMLCGGAALVLASGLLGEWSRVDFAAISARSVWSLAYLIFFGAILAFSAYVWLLQATTPAMVATYAYVNPVIAILIGWIFGDQELSPSVFVASGLIVFAVVLITTWGKAGRSVKAPAAPSKTPLVSAAPARGLDARCEAGDV